MKWINAVFSGGGPGVAPPRRSQDFGGEGSGSGSLHQKAVRGVTPRKNFEKPTCDLVHYIASVA